VNNSHQWEAFNNYIDVTINQQHKTLEQADNTVILHRAQGSIAVLQKLKLLRDEVNNNG
tara:strand:- start:4449 stop:4625 length:177 start_codon:yes stop_codon:yes gene_type:complete